MSTLPACFEKPWVRLVCCLLVGAVGALSMPPFTTATLFFSFSLYWLLLTTFNRKLHIFSAGFLYGFGYFVASLWWVGNALLVGGNPFIWALPLAVCGLQALLALFPMVAASSQIILPGRSLASYLIFIVSYSFWEWGRGHFFTGFPWNLAGMMWTSSLPMLQSLSLIGIYGLTLITIFVTTVPAFAWKGQASKRVRYGLAAFAVLLLAGMYVGGQMRLEAHHTNFNNEVVVQLVTPNIPQADKWEYEHFWNNYKKTVDAIRLPPAGDGRLQGKTRLIVLPETAFQYSHFDDPRAVAELQSALQGYPEKTYLLTGLLRKTEDGYHNSLVGYDSTLDQKFAFDKFHLVPFGEYIPFQKYIPIGPVVAFSGFQKGNGPASITLDSYTPSFSPLVCYEVIFPHAVINPDTIRPEWMVNVTNDAWYGISPGPYQHLGHAVYRAIEEGLPMARSTNTGVTAMIDPVGRILNESPLYETYVQESFLPRALSSPTLYALLGDKIFFILLIFMCLLAYSRRTRS